MSDNHNCSLAEGFNLWEKIYAQFSFIAMSVIGTAGIVIEDWPWILPYIFINWYGLPGIVMRHLVCPRCPHLYKYGDCLQLSKEISRLIHDKQDLSRLNKNCLDWAQKFNWDNSAQKMMQLIQNTISETSNVRRETGKN